jgi:flagellar M-ring protein FliF
MARPKSSGGELMRSFNQFSPSSVLGRFRPWLYGAWQSMLAQRPEVRWGLLAIAVVALSFLIYMGVVSLSPVESSYLASSRRFSSDDLIKVCRALERQRIDYRVDDQRRVAVAADQFDLAVAAIAKLDIGPRPLGELRAASVEASLWESIHDKELREYQGREKILESMINDLPGVVGSFVWINRPKARWGLRPTAKSSAFVRLETEGDRQLPFGTVQSITTILTGYEPGLIPEAVTVMDRRGHKYLDAGNPALSALSHNRAREEELSQEVLEKLDWIKGVRVSVQLGATTAPGSEEGPLRNDPLRRGPADPATATAESNSNRSARANDVGASCQNDHESPLPAPEVAVNRPLALEPAPPRIETVDGSAPPTPVSPPSSPASASARQPRLLPDAGHSGDGRQTEQGRIWVTVPRSYYYHVSNFSGHREPSQDELKLLVAKTEKQIRTAVGLVVPESWKTTIDVIPDEVPLNRPQALTSAPESRRVALDRGIAGAIGAITAALLTVGAWVLSARRPASQRESARGGFRYHRGSASARGPSERVREFVLRNPEAAAAVLDRWIAQGGDVS